MKWSRYGLLFASKRNGWLLYSSASNSFLQLEEAAVPVIRKIQQNPNTYDYAKVPDLYFHLKNGGFLVDDTKDDDLVNILKMRRLTANYAANTLLLTIAPTRDCNFACPYCFEGNRTASLMTEETEDKIVEFIKKHKAIQSLALVWYGGEPLLAFERIQSLNAKIQALNKTYISQIITNGFCLSDTVIRELDNLKTTSIQITLDGKKETHNSRRYLIGGGETFDTIVANLDNLMASNWKGRILLRVNVDNSNCEEFVDVYRFIQNRYPDKYESQISVYPGFVHGDENPDINCYFNSKDKGQFLVELSEKYGINVLPIFPHLTLGGCTMTKRNAYVIGPEGELYKCWNEVGNEKMVIGTIDSMLNWNMSLVAEGMTGSSWLDDEKCKACFFFPICDGGCARTRMISKQDGIKRDTCSYFKSHLKELLEIHYEQRQGGKSTDA